MFLFITLIIMLVISRLLGGFFELILIKLFKMNKSAGIVISMILAFVIYLLPGLLLGSVSELEPDPARRLVIAAREADSFHTGIVLMAISCIIWIVVDLAIAASWKRKTQQREESA